jgi:hypothetical protein
MKLRLGSAISATVIDQLCRWSPRDAAALREMKAPLGLLVEIGPIKPRRTAHQNARYWVIVTALADYVGMSKNEMHNECLSEMHGFDLVEFRGSAHKRPRGRSHNLTREDFSALMLIAERWAADMGISWEDVA